MDWGVQVHVKETARREVEREEVIMMLDAFAAIADGELDSPAPGRAHNLQVNEQLGMLCKELEGDLVGSTDRLGRSKKMHKKDGKPPRSEPHALPVVGDGGGDVGGRRHGQAEKGVETKKRKKDKERKKAKKEAETVA